MTETALLLIIIAAVLMFSIQNEASVSVSFLFWRFETPLAVVIFFTVMAGVLVIQLLQRRRMKRPTKDKKPHDV